MDSKEIHEHVLTQFKNWIQQPRISKWEPEISPGAINAITQMIINIEKDPSGNWKDFNAEEAQLNAISLIPNILNDIFRRPYRRPNFRQPKRITSWEIWHGLSRALEDWCPIPKEF